MGTIRYMSVKTYLGVEQARRDNLGSLTCILMYYPLPLWYSPLARFQSRQNLMELTASLRLF